jgi:uncharacterized UBP type Zn finger protein
MSKPNKGRKAVNQHGLHSNRSSSRTGLCGLENQGATCYLNSLIQVLYMTPELRHGLFLVDPDELGVDLLEPDEPDETKNGNNGDGPSTEKGELEADEAMLEQLKAMGLNEHGAAKALVVTKNSLEEAMDYCFAHGEDPGFNDPPPGSASGDADNANEAGGAAGGKQKKKKKARLIPLELQRLFTELLKIDKSAVSTASLTTKGFQWQGMDGRVQHDAHELQKLLVDAMDRSLKRTSGANLIPSLYNGEITYQTQCLTCMTTSERKEPMTDLNLVINKLDTVEASLRAYFEPEMFAGADQYVSCPVILLFFLLL